MSYNATEPVADVTMRGTFTDQLNAYLKKAGTKSKLFSKEKKAAYVACLEAFNSRRDSTDKRRSREAIRAATANPYCTFYQVVTDYKMEGEVLYKLSANKDNMTEDGSIIRWEDVKRIATVDEVFSLIRRAHLDTNHSGTDITYKELQHSISNISMDVVSMYRKLCCVCAASNKLVKKPKAGHIPIVTKGFGVRGQVDLIDFQSMPDGDYHWVMQYQDHGTKFCWLVPLATKEAVDVAKSLLFIFGAQGFPMILQSVNGREFVNQVITAVMGLAAGTKIIHGRPLHPESQGSVERSNGVVKKMLYAWMRENSSTNWSMGLPFVMMCKNNAHSRATGDSPYKLVYGQNLRRGIRSQLLPAALLSNIVEEEELEALLLEHGMSVNDLNGGVEDAEEEEDYDYDDGGRDDFTAPTESSSSSSAGATTQPLEVVDLTELVTPISTRTVHACGHCKQLLHAICGEPWYLDEAELEPEEGYGARRQCSRCCNKSDKKRTVSVRDDADYDDADDDDYEEDEGDDISESPGRQLLRERAHQKLKQGMYIMKKGKVRTTFYPVGSDVKLSVPKVDRAPCDTVNIIGVVKNVAHISKHRIGFKAGVLDKTMLGHELELLVDHSPAQHGLNAILEATTFKTITLREAAASVSVCGGQENICHCKGTCLQNKCSCLKAGRKCGNACHRNNSLCCNK